MFSLDGTNCLHWDAILKKQKLMMTASASASQFLPLKAVLRVALGCNILEMHTGIPLGIQSGSILHQDKVGERGKMEHCEWV